jgi:hypothetical protein
MTINSTVSQSENTTYLKVNITAASPKVDNTLAIPCCYSLSITAKSVLIFGNGSFNYSFIWYFGNDNKFNGIPGGK